MARLKLGFFWVFKTIWKERALGTSLTWSRPHSSANTVQPNLLRLGNSAWKVLGVNFWSMDFFGFWFLPQFHHPRHLKSGVPPPPTLGALVGVQPFLFLMWKMSFVPINWQDAGHVSEKALYINFKWRLILKKCVFSAIIQRSSQTQYFSFLLPFLAHRFCFLKLHPLASSVEMKKKNYNMKLASLRSVPNSETKQCLVYKLVDLRKRQGHRVKLNPWEHVAFIT